jgi:hypothetical protein
MYWRPLRCLPLRRRGVTVVDDREGDIYPKWATEHAREGSVPQDDFHLLTRAMVDRRLANPETDSATLFTAAATFPVAGTRKIELPARQPDRAKRTAEVEIRFGEVEVRRPRDERDRTLPAPAEAGGKDRAAAPGRGERSQFA